MSTSANNENPSAQKKTPLKMFWIGAAVGLGVMGLAVALIFVSMSANLNAEVQRTAEAMQARQSQSTLSPTRTPAPDVTFTPTMPPSTPTSTITFTAEPTQTSTPTSIPTPLGGRTGEIAYISGGDVNILNLVDGSTTPFIRADTQGY